MWKLSHPALYRAPTSGKIVTGATVSATATQEMYKNFETVKRKTIVHAATMPQPLVIDLDLLPAASEAYCISPDPKDYILVQLPIVTVGIPNRNLQAFPLEEVGYFDPQQGKLVYQTFNYKGTYIDHANSDPRQAKGIIVDSSMQYVPKYDLWKINIVTLWDRSKDKKLVDDILNKKRTGYSMGCYVMHFVCSICGKMDDSCVHMQNKGALYGEQARLSYQSCASCTFFETSSVDDPADASAVSTNIYE